MATAPVPSTNAAAVPSQRIAGREHFPVPVYPSRWLVLRIAQLVGAILCLALAAYAQANWIRSRASPFTIVTALSTFIVFVYYLVAQFGKPAIYNYWAVIALDAYLSLLWFVSFVVLITEVADNFATSNHTGGYLSSSHGLIATVIFASFEFSSFATLLGLFAYRVHHHRAAGRHSTPAGAASRKEEDLTTQFSPGFPPTAYQPHRPQSTYRPASSYRPHSVYRPQSYIDPGLAQQHPALRHDPAPDTAEPAYPAWYQTPALDLSELDLYPTMHNFSPDMDELHLHHHARHHSSLDMDVFHPYASWYHHPIARIRDRHLYPVRYHNPAADVASLMPRQGPSPTQSQLPSPDTQVPVPAQAELDPTRYQPGPSQVEPRVHEPRQHPAHKRKLVQSQQYPAWTQAQTQEQQEHTDPDDTHTPEGEHSPDHMPALEHMPTPEHVHTPEDAQTPEDANTPKQSPVLRSQIHDEAPAQLFSPRLPVVDLEGPLLVKLAREEGLYRYISE